MSVDPIGFWWNFGQHFQQGCLPHLHDLPTGMKENFWFKMNLIASQSFKNAAIKSLFDLDWNIYGENSSKNIQSNFVQWQPRNTTLFIIFSKSDK